MTIEGIGLNDLVYREMYRVTYFDASDQIIDRGDGAKVKDLLYQVKDCVCFVLGYFIGSTDNYIHLAPEIEANAESCWTYNIPKHSIIEIKLIKVIE